MKKFTLASLIVTLIMTFTCQTALAVDGYKWFLWKMPFAEVEKIIEKEDFCNLEESGKDKSTGVETYLCTDFPFGEENRLGFFMFIEKKLYRIGIEIGREEIKYLAAVFNERFDKPASGELTQLSSRETAVGWASDTILIRSTKNTLSSTPTPFQDIFTPDTATQRAVQNDPTPIESDRFIYTLIYTSKEFNTLVERKKIDIYKKSTE